MQQGLRRRGLAGGPGGGVAEVNGQETAREGSPEKVCSQTLPTASAGLSLFRMAAVALDLADWTLICGWS